ncbi:uncharacterized protein UTRI_03544_B [Ustilago trichophora]|uniref:Alpha/beta hydrolase fold-3 domain-containing protein n=1 Tax=Ustilago trichophora TaxID=86804 RepID=A0A5C3E088_9BASI|nr:uncharacterized protein UTRI_03544_B [Ustilago trichophora]
MLDILRPAASKVKPTPAPTSARAASPTTSPASSTSTLKASSSSTKPSHSRPDPIRTSSKSSTGSGTARSKGQQARRQSIESAVSSTHRYKYTRPHRHEDPLDLNLDSSSTSSPGLAPFRRSTFASSDSHFTHNTRGRSKLSRTTHDATSTATADPFRDEHSRTRKRSRAQKPLLGGLYFSDLIVVAFFYAVNLLRTCGIAELVDVAFKAFTYACTRLPFDFYQRWSLSRPASSHFGRYPPLNASASSQHRDSRPLTKEKQQLAGPAGLGEASASRPAQISRTASAIATSSDEETSSQETFEDDAQLSPFHHLTLLLVRFACTSFPHLVPRVLFAEETIGPLVRWRTGGGAAGIVREFTSEQLATDAQSATSSAAPSDHTKSKPRTGRTYTRPGFRAFWIGADAHVPVEVRRSDPSSKSATTLLYLHGGGFSLGSVAFYAEALIRIITKVCGIEDRDNDARCVAVEYDLGPTSRFPGPLLQCLRCYAHLVEVEGIDPASITVAGDSAGGNLTMAMLLCLDGQARADPSLGERDWSKLPMPGKAVLISPWADLRPSASMAFAPLREAAAASAEKAADGRASRANNAKGSEASPNVRVSAWTEAIGQHEWDYVAAEALMHFAQLYAGVLKTPRRVRGPMGWVAHMCAVLAGDDGDDATTASAPASANASAGKEKLTTSTATAPLAILRTLLLPPQRIARAAHNILTEPLLNRTSSSSPKTPFSSASKPSSDAFNQVEHIRPSAAGALDPIFPASERKTDAVASTADLYIPIWDSASSKDQQEEESKRDTSDPDFEAAKALLETSKLVNPAIGDWSRIKLKRGMLVLWGDRERLAEDIEVWIDGVRQSQSVRSGGRGGSSGSGSGDDRPSQDLDPSLADKGQTKSLQERRAASRSPHRLSEDRPEHAADWLCTAVEHGPGGVHAWPFVSMYLAGSEAEREKGLEIIARFIAESFPSPASTHPPTPASLAVQLPMHEQPPPYLSSVAVNSPPHLNAVSPAGSMPSDISSRGDPDERDYPFLAGSSYTESEEGWDADEGEEEELGRRNELGLQGVYPHETVWTEPTPTPSTGAGTPLESEPESVGHDELVRRVGLGLGGRGEMMEPVHLLRPHTGGWGGQYSVPQRTNTGTSHRSSSGAGQFPQTLGGPTGGRSLADLEAESDLSAPPSRPDSPGWREDSVGYDSHDDVNAPSPQEIDRDDAATYFGGPVSYADDAIPMDPGFYGLAHYHTLRPEGLSDIAEEESQFDTSSVLSSGGHGGGGDALSPGYSELDFSPETGRSPNITATRGRFAAAAGGYTPSAAEMARLREALDERERQYQERFARGNNRFPIEEDDSVSIGEDSDADVDQFDVQQEGHGGAWRSSAQLPQMMDQSSTRFNVGIPENDEVGGSGVDLQPPPSPTRSNSSKTSSAHDVWW